MALIVCIEKHIKQVGNSILANLPETNACIRLLHTAASHIKNNIPEPTTPIDQDSV